MSDNEYDMEWDDNEGGDGWGDGSGSDNPGSEGQIEIENTYYEAEGMHKEDPQEALDRFESVIMFEQQRNEFNFSFSATKFVILLSGQLGAFEKMIKSQKQLLKLTDKASRNEVSEAINQILDCVEKSVTAQSPDTAKEMYTLTLTTLRSYNERLWFTTSLRLAKMHLDGKQFEQVEEMLANLKRACLTAEAAAAGGDLSRVECFDVSKGSMLLEVFAFEIQMCIELKEQRRMKQVFSLTPKFSSTIEDPRVVGIIKECGGKMYMSEKKWSDALQEFMESFKNYVECGSPRSKTLLKYVILSAMLSGAEQDVQSTQEAKIFSQDPEIIGMTTLKIGFQSNDINSIQAVLEDQSINLLSDPFIAQYLDDLLRRVRLNALCAICRPYKLVKLEFLATKMNVEVAEIRRLLSELILEQKLEGQIDQLNGILELRSSEQMLAQKHRAMNHWGAKLLEVHSQLCKQVAPRSSGFGDDDMTTQWM